MKQTHKVPIKPVGQLMSEAEHLAKRLEGADVPKLEGTERQTLLEKIAQAPRCFDTTTWEPSEPQPDYREQFIDQVAIGLICRGRGHTDAWRVAEAAWDQRQVHKALKKP